MIVLNAVSTYNVGIAHLIKNEGDAQGAIQAMEDFISTLDDPILATWWKNAVAGDLPDAT